MIRKIFGTIYLIWGLIVFFSGCIIALPFILIAGFVLPPKMAINTIYFFIRCWAVWITILTQIYYFVYNRPKYDSKQAFIYVSNHNSYLDSPAIVWAIPGGFKPLGKIEIMKVPLFSIIYKKVCVH
jgi:1-acyl-sn-glycerol-3-phosphate acyltransferase